MGWPRIDAEFIRGRSGFSVTVLAVAAACGGGSGAKPPPDSPSAASASSGSAAACASAGGAPTGAATVVHTVSAVQLGAFAEAGRAAALRDSLTRAGWEAYASEGQAAGGRRVTRVVVSPTSDHELARYVAGAFARAGRPAVVIKDSAGREAAADALLEVNRGTHGMGATVRWALSPDRCTLLAVEDPYSVEAEPVPNGFLLASERGRAVVQQDGVWDVAPSPDWTRLAYGRAFIAQAGGADSLSPAQWSDLARRVGLDARAVREAAFVVSDMGVAYGAARAAVVDLRRAYAGPRGTTNADAWRDSITTQLPVAAGWRVRWSPDGRTLLLGSGPAHGRDDAPPRGWLPVDAERFTPSGAPLPGSAAPGAAAPGAAVPWVAGPTISVGAVEDSAARPISAGNYTVTARDGWIVVGGPGAAAGAARVVGPGIPLAATASARFILALAPTPDSAQFVHPVRLVVYRLRE